MNLRSCTLFFTFLFLSIGSFSQVLEPVHWTVELSDKNAKAGDEVDLVIKATIDNGWHLYSLDFEDCGPVPMSVEFEDMSGFQTVGKLRAIGDEAKHDNTFDCDVKLFEKTAEFRQTIKILSADAKINGSITGQACSDLEGKCVLVPSDFNLSLSGTVEKKKPAVDEGSSSNIGREHKGPILDKSILEGQPSYGGESFVGLLIIAFFAGFAALLTPCVFPMVPMTVTFFLKDNQNRGQAIKKALIFGLSIIVLYTTAGTLFAVILGEEGLNALATNWILNLFIFVVFIVFALSFFGLFEINAPYKLVNKADQQAEKGGLIGVFFMATTLVLISFSCTVPIVGSVLALSAGGAIVKPILMMFFYSLAFALPFTIFAFFPEMIKSLPKSGGWLNTVKVSLAFLELALSLKFFSIADQAYHWGLLDREVNLALWIVIFTMLGVYLLGKIRLPGDTPVEKVGVVRLLLSILVLSFVVYLVPGMWGAPLKALAGYLPPMYTHDFDLVALNRPQESSECGEPLYADFLHLPHGLAGYFDYDQALACARSQNKPLFIDFTGHGCTNCREMEAVVWPDPEVLKRLQNDYVVVALYVDDKTELPEEDWYTSPHDGKVKKTIGNQNADLQISNLENNAQPFYVLVGKDERVLAWPYGYDRSPKKFVEFLDAGKKKYKELFEE